MIMRIIRNNIALPPYQTISSVRAVMGDGLFHSYKKASFFSLWYGGLIVLILVCLVGLRPALAQELAPVDLDVPRLAHETQSELIALGCEEVDLTNKQALLAARAQSWQLIIPVDANGNSMTFCSIQAVEKLQPLRGGQVKQAATGWREVLGRIGLFGFDATSFLLTGSIGWLFTLGAQIGGSVFSYTILLLTPLFLVSEHITNSTVRSLWPIVLGIVNLGFMLALVFIALTTVLRLEVGGGVRRSLPRLLLAALLVNFSLVIAGVVIDFTRLLIRVLAVVFSVPDLTSDLPGLLEPAGNFGPIYEALNKSTNPELATIQTINIPIKALRALVDDDHVGPTVFNASYMGPKLPAGSKRPGKSLVRSGTEKTTAKTLINNRVKSITTPAITKLKFTNSAASNKRGSDRLTPPPTSNRKTVVSAIKTKANINPRLTMPRTIGQRLLTVLFVICSETRNNGVKSKIV